MRSDILLTPNIPGAWGLAPIHKNTLQKPQLSKTNSDIQ